MVIRFFFPLWLITAICYQPMLSMQKSLPQEQNNRTDFTPDEFEELAVKFAADRRAAALSSSSDDVQKPQYKESTACGALLISLKDRENSWTNTLSVTPDEKTLFAYTTVDGGGPIFTIWDMVSGKKIADCTCPGAIINLASDGKKAVTLSGAHGVTHISVWNIVTGQLEHQSKIESAYSFCLLNNDTKKVLVGIQGKVLILDTISGKLSNTYAIPDYRIPHKLAVKEDGHIVLVTSEPALVSLDANTNKVLWTYKAPDKLPSATSMEFILTHDQQRIVVRADKYIYFLNAHTGVLQGKFVRPDLGRFGSMSLSVDEEKIIHTGETSIHVFDIRTGNVLKEFSIAPSSGEYNIKAFAFTDGKIITASNDLIRVWKSNI